MKNKIAGVLATIATCAGIVTFSSCKNTQPEKTSKQTIIQEPEIVKEYEFGFRTDTLKVIKDTVEKNEFVSEMLGKYNVSQKTIHNLEVNAKEVFPLNKFRAGKPFTVLVQNSQDTIANYLIYEKNPVEYVTYNLQDPTDIQLHSRPIVKKEHKISGIINGSLWTAMANAVDTERERAQLVANLAQIYQWTIDFTRITPGDQFKAVYDDIYIDYDDRTGKKDKFYKTDSISSAYFNHNGKEYYAFYFDQGEDKQAGFYDENGESLKRAFLRAPVKYSRISSRYSGRRFHPVQKRYKSHLGTDYAAPTGTPIYSTADGTVIKASYTRGNGRYVKVKHNKTYTTQYLHMSKIAKGMKPGKRVSQGEVIGYVGSTGLATGPHVCYRFWKNGKQVNHLSLDIPSGDPIEPSKMEEFNQVKEREMAKLASIEYPEIKIPVIENEVVLTEDK